MRLLWKSMQRIAASYMLLPVCRHWLWLHYTSCELTSLASIHRSQHSNTDGPFTACSLQSYVAVETQWVSTILVWRSQWAGRGSVAEHMHMSVFLGTFILHFYVTWLWSFFYFGYLFVILWMVSVHASLAENLLPAVCSMIGTMARIDLSWHWMLRCTFEK